MWLSHEVTSHFKVPHCFNHKCMWIWWKISRHGSTWKNMAGRSIILFLYFFPVCTGRQTFVQTSFTEGTIWVPHCVSNMNTHGSFMVTMLCFNHECTGSDICMCFNLNTHGLERLNTLHSWQNFILLSIFLILWLFLKSSNNSSFLLNMKDNLSESCSQNPTYCTGFDNCCNIIDIQRHDFVWAMHQVCTLSWDQTCWLDVKFRQHCCTWTQRWLVHVTSSQMNISVCLCIFYAIELWSNSCTLVQLNWMGP